MLIKFSTLMEAANIDEGPHNGFQFQVSKINPIDGKDESFLNSNINGKRVYTSRLSIPLEKIQLSVIQTDSARTYKEAALVFVAGLLLTFTGTGLVRKLVTKYAALGQRLDQTEKDYRIVFEGISEGIFKTTMEGKILLANPSLARIFGFSSPTEMIGMVADIGDQLYYSHEDREKLLGTLLVTGHVTGMEIQSVTKDKGKIWISISAHLHYEKDRSISYIEGTVTDITARKKDRDKLDEQFEVLKEYAFINAHKVRAHVARLLGLVNLINERYITEGEKEGVIKLVTDETEELDKVIRGLSLMINEVEEY